MKKLLFLSLFIPLALFAKVTAITSEKMLDSTINRHEVVVVDFYADWCSPCKELAPILKDLSNSYGEKVSFNKVNIDKLRRLAQKVQVQSIPYVLFFKNGVAVHAQTGLLEAREYQEIIDYILSMKAVAAVENETPESFATKIIEAPGVILDVRSKGEFQSGHIKDARLLPVDELTDRLAELEKYKDTPIYVYCRSGNRSREASHILTSAGFTKVYNLSGGIKGWQRAGQKVIHP